MLSAILTTVALALPGAACPQPAAAPWRASPDGCAILKRGASYTLPQGATEVDIWSSNLRAHLHQQQDRAAGGWAFWYGKRYSVGWVTVNRDVFNYNSSVVVYWWAS